LTQPDDENKLRTTPPLELFAQGMTDAGHNPALSDLRRRIVDLDRSARANRQVHPFGVAELDGHLPWSGLPLGCLHEFMESGVESEHAAAATLFVAGMLARLKGTVLWCLKGRDLFAPALAAAGLHPDRVIYVEARKDAEILPAMEEGLRHRGLAGVVGEVARLPLTASRRLQLAAEGSGVPAFVVRRWRNDAERASADEPNAAFTRWRIAPAPSPALVATAELYAQAQPLPGLGRGVWHVELLRCRGAEPRIFVLESCDAEGRLAVPAVLGDRPDPQTRPVRAERQVGRGRAVA
jgi:protein ImuA